MAGKLIKTHGTKWDNSAYNNSDSYSVRFARRLLIAPYFQGRIYLRGEGGLAGLTPLPEFLIYMSLF